MYSPSASTDSRKNTNSHNTTDSTRLVSSSQNAQKYTSNDNNVEEDGDNDYLYNEQRQSQTPNSNNNNEEVSTQKQQQQKGWMIDRPTQIFAIFMFVVCLGLTIGFSIRANEEYENSKNSNSSSNNNHIETPAPTVTPAPTPIPTPKYDHGSCSIFRNFTMWRSFPAGLNSSQFSSRVLCVEHLKLVRGTPLACKTNSDCQLGVPSICVYGDTNMLQCHAGFCALRTFSIPISFYLPGSGVCPKNSTSIYQNESQATPDFCGDLLVNGNDNNNKVSFVDVATKPVICATQMECMSGKKVFPGGIVCEKLQPI